MKYLYLLLIFACCITVRVSAQSVTWCPPGAEWHYPAANFGEAGYLHTWYQADTVVAGRPCKKLHLHRKVGNWVTGQISDSYWNEYTYEQDGIVFYYAFNFETSVSSWDTLYNFNALSGQTWQFEGWGTNNIVEVQDTGQTVLNGQPLRWYTAVYNGIVTDTVYERIGATQIYPLSPGGFTTDPELHALCNYSDNSFPNWPKPDAACRILATSREDDISEVQFTIYPNPASEKVNILGANPTAGFLEVELYDIYGRKVIREKLKAESQTTGFELNLANLLAGVYIVKILQSQAKTQFLRLVKE